METIFQNVQVTYSYPVYFTTNLFDVTNPVLEKVISANADILPKKVLCVIDGEVTRYHPTLLQQIRNYFYNYSATLHLVCPPLLLSGGERIKNDPDAVTQIQQAINDFGICRQSYVLAIGGGALLDMAGYAAATAHRGVRLLRVPTTVLAQNDSGVGVKNGINAFGKKNFLGSFAPPAAVLNDFNFLTTLSDRDWRSGMAEAIKVALLKDAGFFASLEESAEALVARDMAAMSKLVYRCAQLHLNHIANGGDPFEAGSSRPLDYGHWAAHKLEALSGYSLRHGEAVAIGMALDSTYAYLKGFLAEADWQRIIGLIQKLGFAISHSFLSFKSLENAYPVVLDGLTEFREHLGGKLTITLLRQIGQSFDVHEIDQTAMLKSIELLEKLNLNPVEKTENLEVVK